MDSLTIVIKMTGLLLMVPPGQGGGPTHVLMPATGNSVPPHIALLAYNTPVRKDHCVAYDSIAQMCFVNLEGWSLDPFPTANNDAPTLSTGMTNITRRSGRPVERPLLGPNPGRRLRSRVTLGQSGMIRECATAWFSFDSVFTEPPRDSIPLTSVLQWTTSMVADSIPLIRRPLDPASGDSAETLDVLVARNGPIEMFLLHVPVWEVGTLLQQGHPLSTSGEIPSDGEPAPMSQQPHIPPRGTPATHFHAYYDLVRARGHQRPLPRFVRPKNNPEPCDWGLTTSRGELLPVSRSPTTFTCMLATAQPQ